MKQWTEKLKHNLDSIQTHAYNLEHALRLEAEASKALLEAEEALENAIAQATADGRSLRKRPRPFPWLSGKATSTAIMGEGAARDWLEEEGLMEKTVRDLVREALAEGHVVADYASALALSEDEWQEELLGFDEPGSLRPLNPEEEVDWPWGGAAPRDIASYTPKAVIEGETGPLYVVWTWEGA